MCRKQRKFPLTDFTLHPDMFHYPEFLVLDWLLVSSFNRDMATWNIYSFLLFYNLKLVKKKQKSCSKIMKKSISRSISLPSLYLLTTEETVGVTWFTWVHDIRPHQHLLNCAPLFNTNYLTSWDWPLEGWPFWHALHLLPPKELQLSFALRCPT